MASRASCGIPTEGGCCSTSTSRRNPVRYGRCRYSVGLRESLERAHLGSLRFRLTILPSPSSTAALSLQISIIDANGGNVRKPFPADADKVTCMTWSPDRRFLAYSIDESPRGQYLHLLLGASFGLGRTQRTVNRSREMNLPRLAWLPDGRLIFNDTYSSERGTVDLWAMPMDLRTGKSTGNACANDKLAWGPGLVSPSASLDGRRLVVTKGHLKSDVFLSEVKQKGQQIGGAKI